MPAPHFLNHVLSHVAEHTIEVHETGDGRKGTRKCFHKVVACVEPHPPRVSITPVYNAADPARRCAGLCNTYACACRKRPCTHRRCGHEPRWMVAPAESTSQLSLGRRVPRACWCVASMTSLLASYCNAAPPRRTQQPTCQLVSNGACLTPTNQRRLEDMCALVSTHISPSAVSARFTSREMTRNQSTSTLRSGLRSTFASSLCGSFTTKRLLKLPPPLLVPAPSATTGNTTG